MRATHSHFSKRLPARWRSRRQEQTGFDTACPHPAIRHASSDVQIDERFSCALRNAAHSWRVAVDRRLNALSLTQAGWLTIAEIATAGEPLSQSDLARRLCVEGATIVAMVDRLVKAGLVAREVSTTDRRVRKIVLTHTGLRRYRKLKKEVVILRNDLLANIPKERLLIITELLEELQVLVDLK